MSPALKYLIVCFSLFCSSCSIFENDIDENEDTLINEDYYLDFIYANPKDSLSSVMLRNEGIAGINATYESESVYIKDDGIVYSEVDWEPDHLMFWKHDGVIFGEGRKIGIAYGGRDIQSYECREFPHRQQPRRPLWPAQCMYSSDCQKSRIGLQQRIREFCFLLDL